MTLRPNGSIAFPPHIVPIFGPLESRETASPGWLAAAATEWMNGTRNLLAEQDCQIVDVVLLEKDDQVERYVRIQTPIGVVIARMDHRGLLRWGTHGTYEDPTYAALERLSSDALGRHTGIEDRVRFLQTQYRALRPNSHPIVRGVSQCPICASSSFLDSVDVSTVRRCRDCGFSYRGRQQLQRIENAYRSPTGEYFVGGDDSEADHTHGYENYEEFVCVILGRPYLEARAELFERLSGKDEGSVLEVGCATGEMLAVFRNRGWRVAGVDFSEYCKKRAEQKHGLEIFRGELRDLTPSDRGHDLIMYLDVFEHIADPRAELAAARRHLASEGTLILELPNQDSVDAQICGADYLFPEHLSFFGPRAISRLLAQAGFEIREVITLHDGYFRVHRFFPPDQAAELLRERRGERLIVIAALGE